MIDNNYACPTCKSHDFIHLDICAADGYYSSVQSSYVVTRFRVCLHCGTVYIPKNDVERMKGYEK